MADAARIESDKSEEEIIGGFTTIGSWMSFVVEAIPNARKCVARYPGVTFLDELENAESFEILTAFFALWRENNPLRPRRRTPAA